MFDGSISLFLWSRVTARKMKEMNTKVNILIERRKSAAGDDGGA